MTNEIFIMKYSSLYQDVHDGCTVSTSASIITNSEVDKSEFVDRDIDFDDWQSDDGSDMYVTVGNNGKMLRG